MLKTLKTTISLIYSASTTKDRLQIFYGMLIGVIEGISVFFIPLLIGRLIKEISSGKTDNALNLFGIILIITIFTFSFKWVWRFYLEKISKFITLNLQENMYKRLYNKPYIWHLNNSVGYISTVIGKVLGNISSVLWQLMDYYSTNITMVILFIIYSGFVSPFLLLYFVLSFITASIVLYLISKKRVKLNIERNKTELEYSKIYTDSLYNVRTIKKLGLLNFVLTKLNISRKPLWKTNTKMYKFNSFQWLFLEGFSNLVFLFPIGYYIYDFITTGNNIDTVVVLFTIKNNFTFMIYITTEFLITISQHESDYEFLKKSLFSNDDTSKNKTQNPKSWKEIKFQNTTFSFQKEQRSFISTVPFFSILKGDHIAITGKSGEGKTTFLNLLTRQFPPQSGTIYLDKTPYDELMDTWFEQHVAYISQDIELFDTTFFENIVAGRKVSKPNFNKIIKGCCLEELLDKINGDVNTKIGEKGIKVSGGEKQRINLARGLLLNRDILILDEITANLDPHTTEKIWKFLFNNYANKTIIAVSHQPQLLNHVDKILYFHKGKGITKK